MEGEEEQEEEGVWLASLDFRFRVLLSVCLELYRTRRCVEEQVQDVTARRNRLGRGSGSCESAP